MLMAKNIDYIYTADPRKDPNAKKLPEVSCSQILEWGLAAIDATAAAFCRSVGLPVRIFGMNAPMDIFSAVKGEKPGTVVTPDYKIKNIHTTRRKIMKFDTKPYEEKMQKSLASYNENLSTIRAGRANPDVLKKINVDYYGSPTAISAIAEIKVTDARTITITAWDKSAMKGIEKAILTSDLGIHPQNDGSCIRLTFPPMTEDRRKELSKQVAKMGEEAKVALRNIRRDANDKIKAMKKNTELTEDEAKAGDKSVQDLTDKFVKEVDAITSAKTKEVMEI